MMPVVGRGVPVEDSSSGLWVDLVGIPHRHHQSHAPHLGSLQVLVVAMVTQTALWGRYSRCVPVTVKLHYFRQWISLKFIRYTQVPLSGPPRPLLGPPLPPRPPPSFLFPLPAGFTLKFRSPYCYVYRVKWSHMRHKSSSNEGESLTAPSNSSAFIKDSWSSNST